MSHNIKRILIGIPCKNEEKNINIFADELKKNIKKISQCKFEILFIDDGSSDNTWQVLKSLSAKEELVSIAKFSKNFGKEQAIKYLINYAAKKNFDFLIPIDADLQHPPSLISKLIREIELKEINMVLTTKVNEKKNFIKFIFTNIFYISFNFFSSSKIIENLSDYSIIDNTVINLLNNLNGNSFIYKASLQSINCKYSIIKFEVPLRSFGKSNFNFINLFKYSIETYINYNNSFLFKFTFYITLFFYIVFLLVTLCTYLFFKSQFLLMIYFLVILCFIWMSLIALLFSLYIYKILINYEYRPSYVIDEEPN